MCSIVCLKQLICSVLILILINVRFVSGQYGYDRPSSPSPPVPPDPPFSPYFRTHSTPRLGNPYVPQVDPSLNQINYGSTYGVPGTSGFSGQLTGREPSYTGGRGLLGTPHFGMPLPTNNMDDRIDDQELTPEEKESKRENPVPYFINPFIKRGTQRLLHHEAKYVQNPLKKSSILVRPLLRGALNPASRITPAI